MCVCVGVCVHTAQPSDESAGTHGMEALSAEFVLAANACELLIVRIF